MRQVCRRLHLCPPQQRDYRKTPARSSTVVERHGIDPERIQDKDHALARTRRRQLPRIQYTTIQVQCTPRQNGRKTLIKPSREAEKRHQASIKETIQKAPNTGAMISRLVPKIVGWRNYYRTVVSRKSFEKMDHLMYWKVFAKVHRDGHAKTVTKQKADAIHANLPQQ